MKKFKTNYMKFLVLFLSFASANMAFSQSEMSLPDLINAALEQNYSIQIFKNNQRQAQNSNTVGNAGMLPNVDLTGEYRVSHNNTEQQYFNGDGQSANNAKSTALSGNIGVNWVVFDGLAMFARKDQLEKLELLSQEDVRFYIEQTTFDVAQTYYRLTQEKKLLESYRTSLQVSQTRFEYEDRAFEVGSADGLDVQQALVDRNTDSSLVLNQKAQIRELEIELNRIINRELTSAITPTDTIELTGDFNLVNLMEASRANNAELNQQQLLELIALSDAKIARGMLFPEVELFGNYSYNNQDNEVGFLASSRQFGPNFGVRIRFNLYSGGQERIRAENLKIEAESANYRLSDLQNDVEASVRVAYLRWTSRLEQVQLEKESVKAANLALKIAAKQYEIGTLTNVDFRVIQLNAVNAQSRFLEAQFAAKSRELELQRLSGKLMTSVF